MEKVNHGSVCHAGCTKFVLWKINLSVIMCASTDSLPIIFLLCKEKQIILLLTCLFEENGSQAVMVIS